MGLLNRVIQNWYSDFVISGHCGKGHKDDMTGGTTPFGFCWFSWTPKIRSNLFKPTQSLIKFQVTWLCFLWSVGTVPESTNCDLQAPPKSANKLVVEVK